MDAQKEMLELVKLEYERTTKFIEGTVGISTSLRGWAITVTTALITIAFTQKLAALALIAAVGVFAFALVDGYHFSLYRQALLRARRLERITAKHYEALARGNDQPELRTRAAAALAANSYGFYSNLRSAPTREALAGGPPIFLLLYVVLVVAAMVSAAIIFGFPIPTTSPLPPVTPTATPPP